MGDVWKALADPTRRKILKLLKKDSLNAGEIAAEFNMTKPSISNHLSILKQADLVDSEKIGQNVKRIRTSKNISQLALSLAIGHKAVGTISMAELCINKKHFNIEHLVKIADVLEVDICEFFK